jgi:hypothetical protein
MARGLRVRIGRFYRVPVDHTGRTTYVRVAAIHGKDLDAVAFLECQDTKYHDAPPVWDQAQPWRTMYLRALLALLR